MLYALDVRSGSSVVPPVEISGTGSRTLLACFVCITYVPGRFEQAITTHGTSLSGR